MRVIESYIVKSEGEMVFLVLTINKTKTKYYLQSGLKYKGITDAEAKKLIKETKEIKEIKEPA